MKSFFCFLFFSCVINAVIAQENERLRNSVRAKYAITIAPSVLPYAFIGLQPGFYFKMGKNHALISEIAFPVIKSKNSEYDKNHFFKVTSELKYYLKRRFVDRQFLSLQMGFIYRNFQDSDSGIYSSVSSLSRIGYSRFTVKSPVFFSAIKWGVEVVQWEKVFMDFFWSLGVRVVPTKYIVEGTYVIGQWSPLNSKNYFFWFIPSSSWQNDKTVIRPQAAFGVRIGKKF